MKILFKKGHKPIKGSFGKGSKHTPETIAKLKAYHKQRYDDGKVSPFFTTKGLPAWNKGRKVATNTGRTRFTSESMTGEKHWNWGKFGRDNSKYILDRTKLKRRNERGDFALANWKLEVKGRDSWKCRITNQDCKGQLEAHHILNWIDYPELRYEVNNGITLCHAHHPRGRANEKRMVSTFVELLSVSKEIL